MDSRFFLFVFLFLAGMARADDVARQQLAAELLALAGTAAVFDSPQVLAALADPLPFLGEAVARRRERLVAEAGLHRWQPPRVWVLQARHEGAALHWDNPAPQLQVAAQRRGYALVNALPLPSAEEAITFLTPGKKHPGLRALLAAYEADVLVLVRVQGWQLWHSDYAAQGTVPGSGMEVLPDLLAEVMAAEQQWPEAGGRAVVQVNGVSRLADFAAVQSALQALPGAQPLQLIRAARDTVWFAVAAPDAEALTAALDAEPRLFSGRHALSGLPAAVSKACRLACRLQIRTWQADVPTKLPATPDSPVQSSAPKSALPSP